MEIHISSEPHASDTDIALIENGIDQFNMTITGDRNYHPIKLFLRDENGQIHGGLVAHIWGGWMYIELLWIEEALRGHDFGTQLVQMAESAARTCGCQNCHLDTFSFQARPFYEKLGYQVYAELPNYPPGHTRYYLRKAL